jgi:integrase
MTVGKLTNIQCKNAKYNPSGKGNKLFDGAGLCLYLKENGGKYWHFYYRFLNKQRTLSFGTYPQTSLAEARDKRTIAKKQLDEGIDPAAAKKQKKLETQLKYENNFEAIARKWHEQTKYSWTPKHAENILRRFEANIFPTIGKRPIKEITPPELLKAVEKVQDKGNHDLAKRMMQMCSKVFRFAVQRGITDRDITVDLKGALTAVKSENRAYLSEKELPEFLEKLENYELKYGGKALTKLAFQLLVLTFVRSGEIRGAKWEEINFEKAEWRIPSSRMKMKTEHVVPLSKQSISILKQVKELTGNNIAGYIFPSQKDPMAIMSENTFLRALEVMGYKEKATAHGFRSTASTILHEHGFDSQWIEKQLAHLERNSVKAAYDHSSHLQNRREMMQWWGNYIENKGTIKKSDKVSVLKARR